jgi:hypothetical protein
MCDGMPASGRSGPVSSRESTADEMCARARAYPICPAEKVEETVSGGAWSTWPSISRWQSLSRDGDIAGLRGAYREGRGRCHDGLSTPVAVFWRN